MLESASIPICHHNHQSVIKTANNMQAKLM